MNQILEKNEMRKAFYKKDSSYDGLFFTAVKTTGIFCRPSCPARKPLPQNVTFFKTVKEALFAGYRPCKRCEPLNIKGSNPEWIRMLLEKIENNPENRIKDYNLRSLGIDPARARRYFLKNFGMTFQAYCRGRRLMKSFLELKKGAGMDDVVFDSGYESYSGFRDAFKKTFGDTPKKNKGKECIVMSWVESPLGPLIAGATDKGICFLEFTDRRMIEAQIETLKRRFGLTIIPGNHKYLTKLKNELNEYFSQERKNFDLPLLYPGSNFQQMTWNALLKIPYGETRSYEDVAIKIKNPKAVRAVGTANGMNRIAILIPCHRVVNKGGKLGGYGGGLWRKQYLLDLEMGHKKL